jgi:hypothetical protein
VLKLKCMAAGLRGSKARAAFSLLRLTKRRCSLAAATFSDFEVAGVALFANIVASINCSGLNIGPGLAALIRWAVEGGLLSLASLRSAPRSLRHGLGGFSMLKGRHVVSGRSDVTEACRDTCDRVRSKVLSDFSSCPGPCMLVENACIFASSPFSCCKIFCSASSRLFGTAGTWFSWRAKLSDAVSRCL